MENKRDLAVLIGLLLTDGCVTTKWKISFINKSEILHGIFREKIGSLFGKREFTEVFNKNGVKRTEVNSKRIVEFLTQFTPTFRTRAFPNGELPNARIPEFFFQLSEKELEDVLRVMFSTDGSVILRIKWRKDKKKWELVREIRFFSKHPAIRRDFASLLKKLGFSPSVKSDRVILTKKKDLIKFAKEIRFVDGVKVTQTGMWSGMEKNRVLDILEKTFELRLCTFSREIFPSKKDVMDFLLSLSADPAGSVGRLTGRTD